MKTNKKIMENQLEVLSEMLKQFTNNNILLKGRSGVGKSYVLNEFINEVSTYYTYRIIYLDSEKELSMRNYYPFFHCLKDEKIAFSISNVIKESAKDIPYVGNAMNNIIEQIGNPDVLTLLNEEEKEIYDKLMVLSDQNLLILCDNIQFWDAASLHFIYLLFHEPYFYQNLISKIRFIFSYTLSNEDVLVYIDKISKIGSFIDLSLPAITRTQFKPALRNLGLKKSLQENELNVIYDLIDGHIEVMKQLVQEIEQQHIDFKSINESNTKLFEDILNNKLYNMGEKGKQLHKILDYASCIGMRFETYEIKSLLENMDEPTLRTNLESACNLSLIQEDMHYNWNFAHEIIRNTFESQLCNRKYIYYYSFAECLKKIKPDDFYRRGIYYAKANYDDLACAAFSLFLIQQYKNAFTITEQILDYISYYTKPNVEFLIQMEKAYKQYHKKEYQEAYKIAFAIPDLYVSELQAEKNILISCCLTKKLKVSEKNRACTILIRFTNIYNINNEISILENVYDRMIIAYTHNGNIEKAREYEEKLIESLSKRISYDENAKYKLNCLYRKSNAIYECEIASMLISNSVTFFESGERSINLKDLYIAYINESAVNLDCGNYKKSFKAATKALKLEQNFPNVSYPRKHILRSNYYIAGVLLSKVSIDSAIEFYEMTLKDSPIIPERIFLATNLTSLLAYSGQLDKAYEILKAECQKQNVDEDVEGLYDFSANSNRIVFEYLLRIKPTQELIIDLENMNIRIKNILDSEYLIKKNEVIIEIMKNELNINAKQWMHIIFEYVNEYQNSPCWNYFGLGYIFCSLNNWE